MQQSRAEGEVAESRTGLTGDVHGWKLLFTACDALALCAWCRGGAAPPGAQAIQVYMDTASRGCKGNAPHCLQRSPHKSRFPSEM
jgi:hypothetical protein